MKKTLVLGASPKPDRYAYMAVQMLREYGHPVVAVGARESSIADVDIVTNFPDCNDIDTITVYLSARNQEAWHHCILESKPRRVIFNPGTENPLLEKELQDHGIETIDACTLVMLRTNQY